METYYPTREDAFALLKKYNSKESLIRHGLCVESIMGHFAGTFDPENVEKFKDKSFAAAVDRDVIRKGAKMLDMELAGLIAQTIAGMQPVAGQIGLKGNL